MENAINGSAWDRIFQAAAPMTEQEREEALREMAEAYRRIEQRKATVEHERIRAKIASKLAPPDSP